ncbi:MAG: ABC-2 transporter permease, partial [Ruminococcus sp.]|nr:ABC-2 transporter permease [Ruminococcus sp.]
MKEILKIMRFDFLTAKPFALGIFIIGAVLFFTLSLLFSPIINAYISFVAMIFVMPLQSVADKSNFNKLYGILPVKRSNITRARFLYIFLVIFASEIIEFILAVISRSLKLYRLLPNQNTET